MLYSLLFFSTKYWPDAAQRESAATEIEARMNIPTCTVTDGVVPAPVSFSQKDTLLCIPCSGSVQPDILRLAPQFGEVILFAGYVEGNFSPALCDAMLARNAAPTVMDCFGVLRRSHSVRLIRDHASLSRLMRAKAAAEKIRGSRVLLIGGREPWVISPPSDTEIYRKNLGVQIVPVPHEELISLYERTSDADARHIADIFAAGKRVEPTAEDVLRCARMAAAMERLLTSREADGLAIACFDLIRRTGVNPCLGVSYLNGETPYFAACEGDTDSAVTMLMSRALGADNPFMANPCLQADESVNFAHCTAPLQTGGRRRDFLLRTHHETGVGASPQVDYGTGDPVCMLRYSGVTHSMMIEEGISVPGRYEPNCRTQLRVRPRDFRRWSENILGCHQVLLFGEASADVAALCGELGIRVE